MLGPGVSTITNHTHHWQSKTISFVNLDHGREMLHNHPNLTKLLLDFDLFVLFNSGVGSPALREAWDPTLRLLLQTRKPIVFTCHSRVDLDRDWDCVEQTGISEDQDGQELGHSIETLLSPHENPFASLRRVYDSKEQQGAEIVTTNQFIFALQAK